MIVKYCSGVDLRFEKYRDHHGGHFTNEAPVTGAAYFFLRMILFFRWCLIGVIFRAAVVGILFKKMNMKTRFYLITALLIVCMTAES